MPLSGAAAFRGVLLLLMTMYVFLMYCMARSMAEEVGPRLTTMLTASAGALALIVPLVWIVGLPEVPDIYVNHVRARRRWVAGRCPQCDYALTGLQAPSCPECGRDIGPPAGYRFGARIILRFAMMVAVAWLVGSAAGEWWMLDDERSFAREARTRAAIGLQEPYVRAGRWPSESTTLKHDPSTGRLSRE